RVSSVDRNRTRPCPGDGDVPGAATRDEYRGSDIVEMIQIVPFSHLLRQQEHAVARRRDRAGIGRIAGIARLENIEAAVIDHDLETSSRVIAHEAGRLRVIEW